MIERVEDISGLITVLILTKTYQFVYLLLFICKHCARLDCYCSINAVQIVHTPPAPSCPQQRAPVSTTTIISRLIPRHWSMKDYIQQIVY